MDLNKCLNKAEAMAEKAIREDQVKIGDAVYNLRFNALEWVYNITDQDGNFVVNFNTKKITEAKKWLKQYLSN